MELKRDRMGRCGLDSSDSGLGPAMGFNEHGTKPLCCIKGRELAE